MKYLSKESDLPQSTSSLLKWILNELKTEEQKQPIKQSNSITLGLLSYHATHNKRHQQLMHAYFVLAIEKNPFRAKSILGMN